MADDRLDLTPPQAEPTATVQKLLHLLSGTACRGEAHQSGSAHFPDRKHIDLLTFGLKQQSELEGDHGSLAAASKCIGS